MTSGIKSIKVIVSGKPNPVLNALNSIFNTMDRYPDWAERLIAQSETHESITVTEIPDSMIEKSRDELEKEEETDALPDAIKQNIYMSAKLLVEATDLSLEEAYSHIANAIKNTWDQA